MDLIVEYCPECDRDAQVYFDVNYRHYIYCPNCGRKLMLCSECPVRDGEMFCDWSAKNPKEKVCNWDERVN